MKTKLICAAAGILVIFGFLLTQGMSAGLSAVMLPSEVAEISGDQLRLRVAGKVTTDAVAYQVEPDFLLEFMVADPEDINSKKIAVRYAGIKPDMFASNRDVIIDGSYDAGSKTLVASTLLTQCPSKYEPPKPGEE